MKPFFNFLKAREDSGYQFKTVFDVGACKGEWSQEFKQHFPASEMVLFEANPAYKNDLDATGFKNFNCLLSDTEGKEVEFYNGTNTGDSYYKETTKFYDNQQAIRLPCFTLDSLTRQHALPVPNLLKIDTQGSELDIMAGYRDHLQQVDFIYIELPIITYNAGAPDIRDYLTFFKKNRFIPVELLDVHRGENILVQIDIMFVRDDVKTKYFGPTNWIRPFV